MTVAVRLSTGTLVVPVRLRRDGYRGSESIVESATVHASTSYVVLEPGTSEFTIEGPPVTEKAVVLLRYERIAEVPELPETVATDEAMAELRMQWQNVDAFYRRVEDVSSTTTTPTRTITLADLRIADVDTDQIPASAVGWTSAPDYLGLPAPLTALVPGVLGGVPELVEERISGNGRRVKMWAARHGQEHATAVIEFQIAYADARTRMVKKDPWNNRRNAKRIPVPDTKYVELHVQVPAVIAADTLDAAHAEVDRIVAEIEAQIAEPVAVCATCSGNGLVLTGGVRERKL